MKEHTLLDNIVSVVAQVEKEELRATLPSYPKLEGLSGNKLIALKQHLSTLYSDEACYVEVGVFRGFSLLSVAYMHPNTPCFGIDNYAHFDPHQENQSHVNNLRQQLNLENVHLINEDYEDALLKLREQIGSRRVSVYFVDGPHDYRSQMMCLLLAIPHLAPQAIIVVDDANYNHVRQANGDFLRTNPEFKLLFEGYTPAHPNNLDTEALSRAREGWWNGVNVLVRDPENRIPPSYPSSHRDRTLYENEHLVHASPFGKFAPDAVALVQDAAWLEPRRFLSRLIRVSPRLIQHAWTNRSEYRATNTHSASLPAARLVRPEPSGQE